MPNFISEDQIEKAAVALLKDRYGYRTVNCFTQDVEDLSDRSHRTSKQDVVFFDIAESPFGQVQSDHPGAGYRSGRGKAGIPPLCYVASGRQ